MECSPGGRFLISMVILTPLGAGVRVAVPMLWPCAFLMSTVTGFAAARARLPGTKTRPAAHRKSAAQKRDLIIRSPHGECELRLGLGLSQKYARVQSSASRKGM